MIKMVNRIWSWWKNRQEEKTAERFMGVRLDKNHYLGYSTISYYVDTKEKVTEQCHIHFFVSKEDESKRIFSYDTKDVERFKNHRWMINARMWKLCEKEMYHYIHHPSKYLQLYMAKEYDCEWSEEKKWWVESNDVKYQNALDNQKKPDMVVKTVENNVIQLGKK